MTMPGSNQTFAITGGCGFIGSHLSGRLIASGHSVRILDDLSSGKRSNVPKGTELIVADVADGDAVANLITGCDGVFHLAAIASVDVCNQNWKASHLTNASGTVTVLQAARDAQGGAIPVVSASSAAVYGAAAQLPITEATPTRPISPYGADKLSGELHGAVAASTFDVSAIALRFFNVFGQGQDPRSPYSGVISIFADRLTRGMPITIFGDGQQTRDFIFIDDVVEALTASMARLLCEKSAGRPASFNAVNVCTGTAISVRRLAETMSALLVCDADISHAAPREGEIRHSTGDPSFMHSLLGVVAKTRFEDGLRAVLQDRARGQDH